MDSRVIQARQHLEAEGFQVDTIWIRACLDSQPQSHIQDPQQVLQHALVADFREMALPTLPDDISKLNGVLKGPFVLQINMLEDISNPEDKRFEETGERTLRLFLSDGHQTFPALEKISCPMISIATVFPGAKARVRDLVFRRGYAMLEPTRVEILGGHVQSLVDHVNEMHTQKKNSVLPEEIAQFVEDLTGSRPPPPTDFLIPSR